MRRRVSALFLSLLLTRGLAIAGGPLTVTGPAATLPGKPFVWSTSSPIPYTVDTGPLSVNPSGQTVINNTQGLARVNSLFKNWQAVPTTAIAFSYAGPITGISGGDVKTIADFNTVKGTCNNGTQSPVIFDANGSLLDALGLDPLVIGFTSTCKLDLQAGHVLSALVLLNGKFQDGVSTPSSDNFEISADQFDEAITHELGHFSGLDHSQINIDQFNGGAVNNCDVDSLAGLPLMFPVTFCQSRKSAGLPILAPDDVAWISNLYPNPTYSANYGTLSGYILFSDGITHAQGLNVVARRVDDPNTPADESRRIAMSVVSGFRFTGNPGQAISGDNTSGSSFGSRNPALIGYYEIPVTPGTYTVQIEPIRSDFTGGSSVGPLDPPVAGVIGEYWNQYDSSSNDTSLKNTITVTAGQTLSNLNFIMNMKTQRFDPYDEGQVRLILPTNDLLLRIPKSIVVDAELC
jgi:hypothetical protein